VGGSRAKVKRGLTVRHSRRRVGDGLGRRRRRGLGGGGGGGGHGWSSREGSFDFAGLFGVFERGSGPWEASSRRELEAVVFCRGCPPRGGTMGGGGLPWLWLRSSRRPSRKGPARGLLGFSPVARSSLGGRHGAGLGGLPQPRPAPEGLADQVGGPRAVEGSAGLCATMRGELTRGRPQRPSFGALGGGRGPCR